MRQNASRSRASRIEQQRKLPVVVSEARLAASRGQRRRSAAQ
jgi:hypothetical protein